MLPASIASLRGGALHYVLLFAKRSRSNLHSLADKQACRLALFDYTIKTAKSKYSMRTSYLAIWCYALCFALCKTFAEQSTLARWRTSSSSRFAWLYGRQSFYKLNRPVKQQKALHSRAFVLCCTKFAPKSLGCLTPIQLDKLEFDGSFNCFYGISCTPII